MSGFDLDRLVTAQAPVIEQVKRELAAGSKRTHWMWFVFPQLRSLGRSSTAQFYGLDGLAEARAYFEHEVLGPRLVECTQVVNQVQGRSALQIFGGIDEMKFRSCMTLFAAVRPDPFEDALQQYFGGQPDPLTRELIDAT